MEFFRKAGDIWRSADGAVGGWLPGGGVASPVTQQFQKVKREFTPKNIRDKVAIPILDKGIESGVLPATPAMFARYLSGTSNPLTVLPESIRQDVSELASQRVDPQQKAQDVYDNAYSSRARQLWSEAWTSKKDEAISDIRSKQGPFGFLRKGNQSWLEAQAQINPAVQGEFQRLLAQDTSPERTRALEAKETFLKSFQNQDSSAPFSVSKSQAYRAEKKAGVDGMEISPSTLTLGAFTVDPRSREIVDRYKFDDLEKGKNKQGMYPDAMAGGQAGSFLIDFALDRGWINPESGYAIKAKY